VPESKLYNYPVFIFSHDFSKLVFAETLKLWKPFYQWENTDLGFDVIFAPSLEPNNTAQAYVCPNFSLLRLLCSHSSPHDHRPQLLFSDPAHKHDANWSIIRSAGEMAPGVQSTVFHTSFNCVPPWERPS
jgi:hypothetical protein